MQPPPQREGSGWVSLFPGSVLFSPRQRYHTGREFLASAVGRLDAQPWCGDVGVAKPLQSLYLCHLGHVAPGLTEPQSFVHVLTEGPSAVSIPWRAFRRDPNILMLRACPRRSIHSSISIPKPTLSRFPTRDEICCPGRHLHCLEMFLVVPPANKPPASSREKSGILLNTLQCTGCSHQQRITWPQTPTIELGPLPHTL